MIYNGKVHKVGDHIDTDAIIPARFLVTADQDELGKNCMEGLEPGWVNRVEKNDILVGGKNFGCGSSREHAPLAILGAGIPIVLAHSFARIFYRNGFNMGLMLLEVGDNIDNIDSGDSLEIDIKGGKIINRSKDNLEIVFQPIPEFMLSILENGGLVGYVSRKIAEDKTN